MRGPWRSVKVEREGGKGPKGSQCYFIEQRVWLLELPMTRETPRDGHKPIYLLLRYFSQTRALPPLANRRGEGKLAWGVVDLLNKTGSGLPVTSPSNFHRL